MLITSVIKMKIVGKMKKYYSSRGYKIFDEEIEINIADLPKGSCKMVECSCDDCGKNLKMTFQNYNKGIEKNKKTICNKCIKNYFINPFSKNEVKEKIKKTMIEKYGFDSPLKIEEIKEKYKKTMIEKYGSTYSFDNEIIEKKRKEKINNRTEEERKKIVEKIMMNRDVKKSREKFKKTMIEKYGVENALQNEDIKRRLIDKIKNRKKEDYEYIINKMIEKNKILYGVDYPLKLEFFKDKSRKTKRKNAIRTFIEKHKMLNIKNIDYENSNVTAFCDIHGDFEIGLSAFYHRSRENHNLCIKCNPLGSYINQENELLDFIENNYAGNIERHKRTILNNLFEIDIYLPSLNIGFEFNGLYWHNELNKDKNYHLEKTEECEKNGIKLIHIYEDDWLYKQEIVKSRILSVLGESDQICAIKCEIKEINDDNLIKNFLENNHLQGFVSSKIKIGLFYQDNLVSLMLFGNLRKSTGQSHIDNSYEILRFCNKLNINVIGGSSKLFKYFLEKYNPNKIINYADRSWSRGNLYEKLGFKLIHKTNPNYYYIINRVRKYRFNFRKEKLIKEGFDKNKTEHEIMLERKIYRIYDSGNLKYIYHK